MDKEFKPTFIDNAILKAFPSWGLNRIKNRFEASMISGAYQPTRPNNRPFSNYTQFLTSPNSRVTLNERQKLVNFNRFMVMSGLGGAMTNRLTDHAVGSGLTFRASVNAEYLGLNKEQAKKKNQEFTSFYKLFFQAENGHYERMYSGGYLQTMAFKSMLEGGDNFVLPVRTKPRKNHRFPFALQTFESERVQTPRGLDSNERFYQGVERNENGVPVRVYVSKPANSGVRESAYFNPNEWDINTIFGPNTGIRQVFQIKNIAQDRPGALRGIPFLTPASGLIIDHEQANDAVLKAVKIQSIFAGLFTGGSGGGKMGKAPGNNQTAGTTSSFPRIDFTAGQIVDLPEGFDLKAFQTTQPGKDFTPYMDHQVGIIGAITGIPRSIIQLIYTKNFSANRGELALYWVTVLRYRIAFILQFPFPFWEYLLSWGVSAGLVSAPGFFDDPETRMAWLGDPVHQFSGPRMPQLDLEKEAKGMTAMRDGGFKSTRGLIESSSEDDPDAVFAELTEERELGLIEAVATQTQQLIDENEQPEEDEELEND
jgi:capsid protein